MIHGYGLTDVGRRRGSNEDSFLVDRGHQIFAVADGMGGHVAGELASRLAIEAFRGAYGSEAPGTSREESMQSAVQAANRRILEEVQEHRELLGMGTTLVAVQIDGPDALIGHVGDSRTYLVRGEDLRLLTVDHSWVNEQVALGILSPREASRHPHRNVITRALGGREHVEVDLVHEPLEPDDILLLCSDGLNTMLEDDEIRRVVLAAGREPESIARALVDAANRRGGIDNVTVVVLRYLPDRGPDDATYPLQP